MKAYMIKKSNDLSYTQAISKKLCNFLLLSGK